MFFLSVDGTKRVIKYQEWAELIRLSFEKHFYIPLGASYLHEHPSLGL